MIYVVKGQITYIDWATPRHVVFHNLFQCDTTAIFLSADVFFFAFIIEFSENKLEATFL